jgi:GNAT superfamily N-acetyltransferase
MIDDELDWRAEEACRVARPAAVNKSVKGWVFRQLGGRIRYANSANPLRRCRDDSVAMVAEAEAFYSGYVQPPLFRVPTMAVAMDPILARLGYNPEGETLTLFNAFANNEREDAFRVTLLDKPDEEWLAARVGMGSDNPRDDDAYRRMIALIGGPKAFGIIRDEGCAVSIAYGVIYQKLLVLESVETDFRFRQRGYGRATLNALIAWAKRNGAEAACLQVEMANAPARALYASVGFGRELYRYHYRRKHAQS